MAMKLVVVSVKDRLANVYGQPMYFATDGQATRAFLDALQDTTHTMNKHPGDYDLYRLGTFDDSTGRFENAEIPTVLFLGSQVKGA